MLGEVEGLKVIKVKQRTIKNGIKNDDWETPQYILDYIKKEYGKFFDPCPINPTFDGLKLKWKKVNFINPPYNIKDKTSFIKKAVFEASQNKICILLIPVVTETKIFIELWNYAHKIYFIHKRIKFKGYNSKGEYVTNKTGQTGSMLVVLNGVRNFGDPEFYMLFKEQMVNL